MRRRLTTIAVTAALMTGAMLTAVPAAHASAFDTASYYPPPCQQYMNEYTEKRAKADKLRHLGEEQAAKKALAEASIALVKYRACVKAAG